MGFSDKQLEYFGGSDAFVNIAEGSVRSGKTHTNLYKIVRFARSGPPGSMMIVGKTKDTVERNIVQPLSEIYPIRYVKGRYLMIDDRRLDIVGANDERAEEKIRGSTLAGALLNEVTLFPRTVFTQVMARCSVDGAQIFADTNPDSPFHWLNKDYFQSDTMLEQDLKRFKFRLDDNPSLSDRYKESLKRLYSSSPLWYRRMILGQWVAAEGAIYDMFDVEHHVIDAIPMTFDKVAVGIDYATSTVCTFIAAGRNNGKWWIFREYYYDAEKKMKQKSNDEYADDFLAFLDGRDPLNHGAAYPDHRGEIEPHTIEIDPSAAGFKVDLRKRGLRQLRSADNDVVEGIRNVQDALANDDLRIFDACTNTQEEHAGYVWDEEKGKQQSKDVPLKENDHTCDAVRYLLKRHYGRPDLRIVGRSA